MTQPNNAGQLAARKSQAPTEQRTLKQYLGAYRKEIAKALPNQIGSERFVRICATALTQNAQLASCTPESFIGAVLNAAQLGLEPNTPLGHAYLIPYAGKCTFQLGYRGMIELARRSGEIAMIKAQAIHENDEFTYTLGLNPDIQHIPAKSNRGKVVGYYAFYKTRSGDFDFEVMTKEEVEEHRKKYSKAKNSPWVSDFDAMAKKTVLKKVLKYAPLSADIAHKIATDETVKSFKPDDESMKDLCLVPSEIIDVEAEEKGADAVQEEAHE